MIQSQQREVRVESRLGKRERILMQLQQAKLTERDEQILWMLAKYNVLRANHIEKLCYKGLSPSRANWLRRNRLGEMAELGILAREYKRRQGFVYWLGEGGLLWLAEQGYEANGVGNLMLRHDLAVADFMMAAQFEIEAAGGNLEWEGVRETEPEVGVKPDAIGRVVLADGRGLVFFLELDRGTEVRRVLDKKIVRYIRNFKDGNWRIRFERSTYPPLLIVTTAGEARERLLRNVVSVRMKATGVDLPLHFTRAELLANEGPLGAAAWVSVASQERNPFLKVLARS